ncbi:MAG TPA: hypothetical protein VGD98_12350 [Ktedonobacteraceae bacterium]
MNNTPITAEECYAALIRALGNLPNVTQWQKKSFGSAGLSIHDKIFAMLLKGKLVIKLPQERVNALIERQVGERFKLGQKYMQEWVTLEPMPEEGWLDLSREAMEFVDSKR